MKFKSISVYVTQDKVLLITCSATTFYWVFFHNYLMNWVDIINF